MRCSRPNEVLARGSERCSERRPFLLLHAGGDTRGYGVTTRLLMVASGHMLASVFRPLDTLRRVPRLVVRTKSKLDCRREVMRRINLPMLVFFLCFVSTGWRQAQAQTKSRVITFDVPDAGTNPQQGTLPAQVTDSRLTVGSYVDVNGVSHGFVRAPDGTITTFDAPGAGMGAGEGTVPEGITDAGIVVGAVFDGSGVFHAFFGSPGGHFTTFDAPNAGTNPQQGTNATSINSTGTMSGDYVDSNGVPHGYVRSPDGTITSFDPSGSVFTAADTLGLNKAGAITGPYLDASGTVHGFLRAPDGTITNFAAPGAGAGPGQGTIPSMITDRGTIPGAYLDANNVIHAFLRFAY